MLQVAAGNEGKDAKDRSPASASKAITVGACDINDKMCNFSNFGMFPCGNLQPKPSKLDWFQTGRDVDFFAPGSHIFSCATGDGPTNLNRGINVCASLAYYARSS